MARWTVGEGIKGRDKLTDNNVDNSTVHISKRGNLEVTSGAIGLPV